MFTPKVALLLVALAIFLLPWLAWRIGVVRAAAPLAVLQILAGVMLGPTLLGRLAPEFHAAIFQPPVLGAIGGLADIGVLLYVFVTGLHLNTAELRRGARALAAPAIGSIALPLLLGLGAGAWLAGAVPGATGARGDVLGFSVAVAICVAVTALPVLAAMLRESGLITTRLGQKALALAALNDAALWLMIALLLALSRGSFAQAAWVFGLSALLFATLALLVRPVLARLERRGPETMLVASIAVAFAAGAAAEALHVGFIIGAFAAGAIVPTGARPALLARLELLVATVLLPFFFIFAGLRATIDPGSGAFLATLALVTGATVIGKVAGTAIPVRLAGGHWRDGLALGSLMQAKGLMEVVVLAVLLDAGLIGLPVYSAMVAMAIVCTVIAMPLLRACLRDRKLAPAAGMEAPG